MDNLPFIDENTAIALLQNCEAKIVQLEAELEQQRAYHRRIREKITELRSLQAPIARLPSELLSQVFGWVGLNNSFKLGTVLLVCRYWKDVACNSPTLWANFVLKMKANTLTITRQTRFVKSALTYSRESPLDIELYLPEVWDLWMHLAGKMLSVSEPYHEQDEEDCASVVGWLRNAYTNEIGSLLPYGNVNVAIYNHIRTLTSHNLHHLRSLTIMFHSTNFSAWTGENFFHSEMPVLEQLIVQTYDTAVDLPDIFRFPAPRLARVATNFNLMVNELVVTEGHLTHLAVVLNESSYNLFPDSRFTRNLTHLYISHPGIGEWVPEQRGFDFQFPVLKDLALRGSVPVRLINAPRLTSLRLCDHDARNDFLNNPPIYLQLTRLHLRAGDVDLGKVVIPYVLRLSHLTELGFLYLYPHEERGTVHLGRVKECAMLSNLVVKGFSYPGDMLLHGFGVYEGYMESEIIL